MSDEKQPERGPLASAMAGAASIGANMMKEKTEAMKHKAASRRLKASENFPMIRLPEGFEIEKVVEGLTFPTSVAWDDQGRMYVAEAGGTFLAEEGVSPWILRVEEGGRTAKVVNLEGKIYPAISGMTWHNGAFYITHREMELWGAVSRVTLAGEVTQILGGIIDSASDHQPNDIRVGPDGRCTSVSASAGIPATWTRT